MRIAVYPGSFDPCTNGHLDIISRSASMFDKLIVAVLTNRRKQPLFSEKERVALLNRVTKDIPNVEVCHFSGLLADFMREKNADIVIKGIRAISDFEYEFQMALTNKTLNPGLETLFLHTSKEYMFLSSSVVKEIAEFGGKLDGLVPECLIEDIKEKFQTTTENNGGC